MAENQESENGKCSLFILFVCVTFFVEKELKVETILSSITKSQHHTVITTSKQFSPVFFHNSFLQLDFLLILIV